MKKPMLLSNDEFDLKDLDYTNMYISVKRDGVRAEATYKDMLGRSLKKFRNPKLYEYFKNLTDTIPEGVILEGEIYCHGIPCREMSGICNSLDKDIPEGTKLHIFGIHSEKYKNTPFEERYGDLKWIYNHYLTFHAFNFDVVKQIRVYNAEEAQQWFHQYISEGFEGAVLMDGRKPYKEGRVTIREHIGFKLKPHKEEDLEIIEVNERFMNTNESMINELGLKYKRNTVDNKQSTGIAATFTCKLLNGETTKVTITGDEAYRRKIWERKEDYIGMFAVVKSMDYGTKDRLRHPRLVDIKVK